jgi:hypothetical protein
LAQVAFSGEPAPGSDATRSGGSGTPAASSSAPGVDTPEDGTSEIPAFLGARGSQPTGTPWDPLLITEGAAVATFDAVSPPGPGEGDLLLEEENLTPERGTPERRHPTAGPRAPVPGESARREQRVSPTPPATPRPQGYGQSSASRTPVDPVRMELGEFVRALQARVRTDRPPVAGAGASAGPGPSASGAPPSPPLAAAPGDPGHLRCAECGVPVPPYPPPARCPSCGRPVCSSCQVSSVTSGAFGRCRECRELPVLLPAST